MSNAYDPHSPEGFAIPLWRSREAAHDRRRVDVESSMIIPSLSGHHDNDELRTLAREAEMLTSSLLAKLQALTRALDKHSCNDT